VSKLTISDDPPKKPPKATWRRDVTALAGILLFIAAFAAFDVLMTAYPATKSANAFVAAMRADRFDEARAHATKELGASIDALPRDRKIDAGAEVLRALAIIRASREIHGGFVGSWTVGCMTGQVDGAQALYLVMKKIDGAWLVTDVRVDSKPTECESNDVE
jgi:hypothetical protein